MFLLKQEKKGVGRLDDNKAFLKKSGFRLRGRWYAFLCAFLDLSVCLALIESLSMACLQLPPSIKQNRGEGLSITLFEGRGRLYNG